MWTDNKLRRKHWDWFNFPEFPDKTQLSCSAVTLLHSYSRQGLAPTTSRAPLQSQAISQINWRQINLIYRRSQLTKVKPTGPKCIFKGCTTVVPFDSYTCARAFAFPEQNPCFLASQPPLALALHEVFPTVSVLWRDLSGWRWHTTPFTTGTQWCTIIRDANQTRNRLLSIGIVTKSIGLCKLSSHSSSLAESH